MYQQFAYGIATADDLPALKTLGIASFSIHKAEFSDQEWEVFCRGLNSDESLTDLFSKSTVFVCWHGRELAGAAYFISSGHPEGMFEKDWSYIRRVSVLPAFQGKGIGKELTRLCIEKAKQTGESIIVLHTGEFMLPAIHIYESLGFSFFREADQICNKRYLLYSLSL